MAKQSPNRLANRGRLTLSRFHRKGKIYAMATPRKERGATYPDVGSSSSIFWARPVQPSGVAKHAARYPPALNAVVQTAKPVLADDTCHGLYSFRPDDRSAHFLNCFIRVGLHEGHSAVLPPSC